MGNRRWKLRYGDHSYVKNGWFLTEGKKYYFNNGICSSGWEFIDDKWYYFDAYTGAMVTEEWRNSNNQWFYLGKDGYIIESEAAENTDILVETTECPTDQTEDQSHNSALEFSSDFSINYDEETGEFYIIGTISSNNKLEKIAFTYCTPYEIFSDAYIFGYEGISCFDLSDLGYWIDEITYARREDIDGDYILIITATDCSGNSISGGLLWVFKDYQLQPF